jgi:cell division initiation protein
MEERNPADVLKPTDIRDARFPQARRGYDRNAVHAFLDRVAEWVEAGTGETEASPELTSEIEKVGERTAGILTAAEEAAAKLRREAKEYAEGIRASAEEESRKIRLNASQKADELIAEAEGKAEHIIDEAIVRRRRLNQAVTTLIERRDEIAEEARDLADRLLEAVGAIGEEEEPAGADEAEDSPEAEDDTAPNPIPGEETALEPPDQRQTTVHEVPSR